MNKNNLNLGPVVGPGIQSTGGKKFEDGLKQGSPGTMGEGYAVKNIFFGDFNQNSYFGTF